MPEAVESPVSRPPSATRSIVHLPAHRSEVFSSRQSPFLPPPTRKTDLPFSSSPRDLLSSPSKPHLDTKGDKMTVAGPSRPRAPVTITLSDDEDDFDGIEDVPPTQPDPISSKGSESAEAATKVTLDDLFAEASGGAEDQVDHEYARVFGDSNPRPGSACDQKDPYSSSPPKPHFSSTRKHVHSDTPPSPLPKTPHTDVVDIAWSPSPMSPRTKRRRALVDNDDLEPSTIRDTPRMASPHSSPGQRESCKGKRTVPEWVDEGYDDLPFPNDFDFDAFDEPSGFGSPGPGPSAHPDHGLAFRPTTSSTRATSPPSERSRIVDILDDLDDPLRLRLITDLTEPEQEFYRNHWRRGADKGSKKRTSTNAVSEDDMSEEEFTGPQPPAQKKSYKRGGGFRRGFRGRGRGRGRARGRK